jgi:hypothetical protein
MQTLIVLNPTFYYSVIETAYEVDKDGNCKHLFFHEEQFRANDLFEARKRALDYYNVHITKGPRGQFTYPFISSSEYEKGVPFSESVLTIYLTEYYGEDSDLTKDYNISDKGADEYPRNIEVEIKALLGVVIENLKDVRALALTLE